MNFVTPEELHDHLADMVNDPELIERMVQVHFPDFKRVVVKPKRKLGHEHDGLTLADRMHSAKMREGSLELLAALHRQHPLIMKRHYDAGRQVVYA